MSNPHQPQKNSGGFSLNDAPMHPFAGNADRDCPDCLDGSAFRTDARVHPSCCPCDQAEGFKGECHHHKWREVVLVDSNPKQVRHVPAEPCPFWQKYHPAVIVGALP